MYYTGIKPRNDLAPSRVPEVLGVPELLNTIVSCLEDGDVFKCALVCKSWSSVALDVLWRTVNSVPNLMSIFGGMSRNLGEDGLCLDADPEPAAWPRFEFYARRVRELVYNEYSDPGLEEPNDGRDLLVESVWDAVARTRTTLHILPNLQRLTWIKGLKDGHAEHQLRSCAMLLHPGLKTLVVAVPRGELDTFGPLMVNIAGRAPNLQSLDLQTSHALKWDPHSEDEFLSAIRDLTKLRKIVVSAFWLTTRVIEALAELPQLRIVQYELFYPRRRGDPQDVIGFAPRLKEGAFPALVDFSLAASVPDTTLFLFSLHRPKAITDLFLHSPNQLPTIQNTIDLLIGLQDWLPHLTKLYLEFRVDQAEIPDDLAVPASFRELSRAIRGRTRLKVLEMYWQYPLAFAPKDLEKIAISLPCIERLVLNPEPFGSGGAALTPLRAIRTIAHRNANIRTLGLLIAVDLADLAYEGDAAEADVAAFAHPIELHIGTSQIEPTQVSAVAMWLSEVCPAGCQIVSGYSWTPSAISPDWDAGCVQTWERVGETVALLTRVRSEERARRMALEKEVDDLRTRTTVLMESASLRIGGVPA